MTQKRTGKPMWNEYNSFSDIDDDHKVPTLLGLIGGKTDNSAEGSFCTREASCKVFSTDSYHSTGAFEPEALRKCGKILFLRKKPT